MLKFLSEFGPLVAFFLGYKFGEIQTATLYMLIASVVGISLCYIVDRKVHTFSIVSFVVILVSASITLISGNSMFIKIKPTILYVFFGTALAVTARQNRPLIKYLLHNAIAINDESWKTLSYRFAAFFLCMAITNELVWRHCDELSWVKFKVFGAIPVTLLFIALQIPFLLRNRIADKNSDKDDNKKL